jgi:hypothetical protein
MDFLKICRAELDRMIEQSPAISDEIIREFEREFKDKPNIKKPDIAHGMDHTQIFKDSDSRLKKLAADAAMMLHMKRKTLNEVIEPEMNRRIENRIKRIAMDLSGSLLETLEARTQALEKQLQKKLEASANADKSKSTDNARFAALGPTYLRSFSRGRAASVISPPPAPHPLTQVSVNHVVPSETEVSQEDLIDALSQRRSVSFPQSSFSMSFNTEENAAAAVAVQEAPSDTVVEVESVNTEPPNSEPAKVESPDSTSS